MSTDPENPLAEPFQRPPPIDKGPLRPAPTRAYDLNDVSPRPQVVYIRSLVQAKAALARFRPPGPLGFDIEWRPTYKKGAPENPVALVQLADNQSVLLFQVSCMSEFPSELREILESSQIVKAGVGIQGDAKKIFKDCNVSMSNCVDLSLLARTVDNARWAGVYNSPLGLARLIECYEYKMLLKGKICRSDWTANLSSKQQEYAGNDAHAGYTLYKRFESMMHLMASQPRPAWYSFNVREGILCNDEGHFWEAENPDYDPGPLPEPKALTEAKLRRKQQRTEAAVNIAASSSQVEDGDSVDSRVQPSLEPSIPISTYPVEIQGGLPLLNSLPTTAAPSSTGKRDYLQFAGKQTATRNNFHHRRLHSPVTNRNEWNEPVGYHSYNDFQRPPEVSLARNQYPTHSGTGNNRRWPRPSHAPNRLSSVNTRDDIGTSKAHDP